MRYFEKQAIAAITPPSAKEVIEKAKMSPAVKAALIGLGIFGAGYGIHRLTRKQERAWETPTYV